LTQNIAKSFKILIITLVFEKNANFFRRKLSKIVEKCVHNIGPKYVVVIFEKKILKTQHTKRNRNQIFSHFVCTTCFNPDLSPLQVLYNSTTLKKKLPPHTPAGSGLTTYNSAGRDDSTRPRTRGTQLLFVNTS
jgi:hypothetical protein